VKSVTSTAVTKWHPATKLLLAAGVLAVPYLLWTRPEPTPTVAARALDTAEAMPPAGEPAPGRSGAVAAPYVMPPLERFTAVVERPLFSPTRRMPAIPEPPPEQPQQAAQTEAPGPSGPGEPDLRFFGTVHQSGRSAALVTFPSTSEVARLTPGDHVGEWEVLAIERNRLVLGIGDERRSFEIFGAGLRQPPPESQATPQGKGGRAAASGVPDQGAGGEDAEGGIAPEDEALPPEGDVPPEEGELPDPGAASEFLIGE
jgi:hypothetical protein